MDGTECAEETHEATESRFLQPPHIPPTKRLHDPMEVVPSMDKPLRVRQKQPCVDSGPDPEGAAADVIMPIAFLWVEQTPLCAALRQLTCEAGVLREPWLASSAGKSTALNNTAETMTTP